MIKGTLYIILFTLLFIGCTKDAPEDMPPGTCNFIDFKYYQGSKDHLGELANNYILVAFDTSYGDTEVRKFISSKEEFDHNYRYILYSNKLVALKLSNKKTCEELSDIIFNLKKNPIIEYVHYTMKTDDCTDWLMQPMGNLCVKSYSGFLYVEVFDQNNLTDLNKMMAETKTQIADRSSTWFLLKTTKNSKWDALKTANYFHESKLFKHADPDIIRLPVE